MSIKKAILTSLATVALVSLSTAQAEIYTKENLITLDKKEPAGGIGTLYGKFGFTRDQAPKDHAIKEIGWMTLQPGDSIGYHQHITNEDTYIIVSGTGAFTDADGQEYPVKAGDITIARKGDSHALKNTGNEPLIFLDIIAEQ